MLEENELSNEIKYHKFTLDKLLMQNLNWEMTLSILQPIPKVWKAYELRFVVDLSTFERRREANSKNRTEINTDLTLFEEDKEETLKRLDKELDNIRDDETTMIEICPDIIFTAFVTQVKYKPEKTVIAFNVPRENIDELNQRLYNMGNYKLSMTHL